MAAITQVGAPGWLIVGWVFLAIGFLSFLVILLDILRGYRQRMAIMDWVYPVTGLYWGPVAVVLYFRRGRRKSARWAQEHGVALDDMASSDEDAEPRPTGTYLRRNWWAISKAVSHCGAGCTIGDIVGEWAIYAAGLSIPVFATSSPNTLLAAYVADFVLAWALGIIFQYLSIVPMREGLSGIRGVWAAIKADTFSIMSFELGLFGFMALYHLVFFKPPLSVASPAYWFMMQIGMVVGYFTAWPVNAWLIRIGWKEKM